MEMENLIPNFITSSAVTRVQWRDRKKSIKNTRKTSNIRENSMIIQTHKYMCQSPECPNNTLKSTHGSKNCLLGHPYYELFYLFCMS